MERQEKSVIGGGSSDSSVERSVGGGFRRRDMGGGIALSRKGKEKRLLLVGYKCENTLGMRSHLFEGS